MVRDFTFVDDIVEGVIRVIDNPPTKSEYGKGSQRSEVRGQRSEIQNPEPETRNPKSETRHPDPSVSETAPYKVYNIGNSSPVQLMNYIKAIEKHLGKEAEKEFLPMQPGDVPKTDADVTDLRQNLNYKPDTPVSEGIRRFVEWYREYYS